MKMLKKLTESLNSNIVMELLSEKKADVKPDVKDVKIDDKNIKGMEDILENSSIGKIAKEVSEELNIESMIGEGGGIENLMNGDNMMNILRVSEKIDNNPNDNIMEEAMDLSKNMKDNHFFIIDVKYGSRTISNEYRWWRYAHHAHHAHHAHKSR